MKHNVLCKNCNGNIMKIELKNKKTDNAIESSKKIQTNKYKCKSCDKGFFSLSELLIHKREHTDSLDFKCDQCGRVYKTLLSLITHLKTHNDKLKLKCNWCPSKFSNQIDLTIHLNKHKFYKCDKCEKLFVWKSKLKNHNCSVRIYNNLKFFSARRKYLKTVRRVWLCNFCDRYYPYVKDTYDHTIYNHILSSTYEVMK